MPGYRVIATLIAFKLDHEPPRLGRVFSQQIDPTDGPRFLRDAGHQDATKDPKTAEPPDARGSEFYLLQLSLIIFSPVTRR